MNRRNRFVGTWVTSTLFEQIEEFIRIQGYMSKSEFLRNLIRKAIEEIQL